MVAFRSLKGDTTKPEIIVPLNNINRIRPDQNRKIGKLKIGKNQQQKKKVGMTVIQQQPCLSFNNY
jgi:hypothetical protein